MRNKNLILIISLIPIWFSGCGPPYDFREHVQLITTTDVFEGYTKTEIHRMGSLERIDGFSSDRLIPKKYVFEDGITIYRLRYQHIYYPGKALYPERLIFLIDGERHRLNFDGSERQYGEVVGDEWAWVDVKSSFLEKIANADRIQFRVVGSNESIDYFFNEYYQYYFKFFYKECVLPSEPQSEMQKNNSTRKIIGYRAKKDTKTGEYKTYPVYEDK